MKTYIKYFLFSVVLLSCQKEEDPSLIPSYYWGEVSAVKNGEEWSTSVYGINFSDNQNRFGVICDGFNSMGFLRERLGISFIQDIKRRSRILRDERFYDENNNPTQLAFSDSSGGSYTTILDDGDVLGDVYEVEESSNNYVEILTYDSLSKEVSGRFEVTFILSDDNEWTLDSPDTIRFTNGVFHTRILDKLE